MIRRKIRILGGFFSLWKVAAALFYHGTWAEGIFIMGRPVEVSQLNISQSTHSHLQLSCEMLKILERQVEGEIAFLFQIVKLVKLTTAMPLTCKGARGNISMMLNLHRMGAGRSQLRSYWGLCARWARTPLRMSSWLWYPPHHHQKLLLSLL